MEWRRKKLAKYQSSFPVSTYAAEVWSKAKIKEGYIFIYNYYKMLFWDIEDSISNIGIDGVQNINIETDILKYRQALVKS